MRVLSTSATYVKKLMLVGTAFAAIALAMPVANASPVTLTLNFTGSGFSPAAPVDPVTGEITLTFDPTVDVNADSTAGITLDNINIPVDLVHNQLAFQYQNFGFESVLTFGTNQGGAGLGADSGSNDFEVVVEDPVTSV